MMRSIRHLPILLAVLLVGCQSGGAKPSTEPKAPIAQADGGETPPTSEAPKPTLDQVPAELKHAGFEYYGLANEKPVDMEAVYSSQPGTMTGAQTISLKEVKDGKAVFAIERTGNLAQLGTQEVTLEKDGIYVTASSVAKVNHDLELPADLAAGKSWGNKMVVEDPGREISMDSTFKVVGPQKVKTKVGDRDALLITSTGKGTMRGQKVTMTSENWYVKGVGGVKSVIKIAYPNGKTETVTIQESK